MEMRMDDIDTYLAGNALYGDDFSATQIAEWYANEMEGYARLGANDVGSYRYRYHAWNQFHAYRHLPDVQFPRVLGFGAAYGDELLPILPRVQAVTIVDPSDAFVRETVHGVPATYVKPAPDGSLPLPSDQFDLTTCFGVLHHIANITFVVGELARTLKPGGYMALREPIVSMGDWRRPRRGLTKRERGCPLPILRRIVQEKGLTIARESLCAFPLTTRVFRILRGGVYNSPIATRFDAALSAAFAWNVNYHPRTVLHRFRPTSVYMVLHKPGSLDPADAPPQARAVPGAE